MNGALIHCVYVKQGANNYEWHVYLDNRHVATFPSQERAAGFADGYTLGLRQGQDMYPPNWPDCDPDDPTPPPTTEELLGEEGHRITPRCEQCEYEAALMAYRAGLGASEWEAFIDRVPPCAGCEEVAVVCGLVQSVPEAWRDL